MDLLLHIILVLVLIREIFISMSIYDFFKKQRQNDAKVIVEKTMESVYKDFPQYRGDIEFLIRHSPGRYIIFIDVQKELEWETKEFPEQSNPVQDVPEISSKVGCIEHLPGTEHFDDVQRKKYLTMLGLSLVQAWESDVTSAKETLLRAEHYVDRRKMEITRKWQLQYCIFCGMLFCVVICVLRVRFQDISVPFCMFPDVLESLYYAFFGVIGVFLSIIHQSGKTAYDCQSGKVMSFLQIFLKYMAGIIAGVIAAQLYGRAIDIPYLRDTEDIGRSIIAIAAGFSERFIPSFIESISASEQNEKV